jgi:hypothetical protein
LPSTWRRDGHPSLCSADDARRNVAVTTETAAPGRVRARPRPRCPAQAQATRRCRTSPPCRPPRAARRRPAP